MLTVRSFLFTSWVFVTGIIGGTLEMLIFWGPHSWKWAIARAWAAGNLKAGKLLCGLDVTTEGAENIPDEPSVALIKHTTAMETYWQIHALPPQTWVLKRELVWLPLFGWGVGLVMKPITIDRKAGASIVKHVIAQGKNRIGRGLWVTIFPEGTRMPPGETKRYGISGAAIAESTGCPVVPVAHNAGDFWPKRGLRKYPGKIYFCIGPAIDPAGKTAKEINDLAQNWIETKMLEISRHYKEAASKT